MPDPYIAFMDENNEPITEANQPLGNGDDDRRNNPNFLKLQVLDL